jgi:hypothetical protein
MAEEDIETGQGPEDVFEVSTDESSDNEPLSTIKHNADKNTTHAENATTQDNSDVGDVTITIHPDTPKPGTSTGDQNSIVESTSTKKPTVRKTLPFQTPKKGVKSKGGKRNISPEEMQCSEIMKSVSSTIEDFGKQFLQLKQDDKKTKDEISVCLEGLEVKIRSMKSRENRLRLMDGLERLTFKLVMEDYLEEETQKKAKRNTLSQYASLPGYSQTMGYCPPPVQTISPQNQFYTQAVTNVSTQQLVSALSSLAGGVAVGGGNSSATQQLLSVMPSYVQPDKVTTPSNVEMTTGTETTASVTILTSPGITQSTVDTSEKLQGHSGTVDNASLLSLHNSQIF